MSKYYTIVMTGADDVSSIARCLTELWTSDGTAARVVAQGVTDKMNQGFLLIAWDQDIPYKQAHQLNVENDIYDYFAIEPRCLSGGETRYD